MKISVNISELVTKFFTFICVTIPITMFYTINNIPLTFIILLFWFIIFLFDRSYNGVKRVKICEETMIIFLFSLIQNLILFFLKFPLDYTSMITFSASLIICSIFVKTYFDKNLAYIYMKVISIFASLFIIVQSIAYSFFEIVISGYIPFLKTSYSHYTGIVENNLSFRPSSFFSEPAAFGIYVGLFLLMCIYKKKISIKQIVILIVGMLLSKSSFALGILIFLVITVLTKYYKWMFTSKKFPYVVIFVICIVFILSLSETQEMIKHVVNFNSNNSIGNGLSGRIGNYGDIKNLGISSIFFGNGFIINDLGYLPGVGNLIVNFGVIGSIIYILSIMSLYIRGSNMSKNIVLIMIYISFFSNSIFGLQPLIYFPLIVVTNITFDKTISNMNEEAL